MLKAAQACAAYVYAKGLQGRHRVQLEYALAIDRRCDRHSRCARQADALIRLILLQQAGETEDQNATTATGLCYVDPSIVPSAQKKRAAELRRYHPPQDVLLPAADKLRKKAQQEECLLALLDEPDHFLSMRCTRALALATVREAMMQALCDHGMQHEQASMLQVVDVLERLEMLLQLSSRFKNWRDEESEESQCALLRHLGRGIELMQRVASRGC